MARFLVIWGDQTPVDLASAAWYYYGVGGLLLLGAAVAIRVLWKEGQNWKRDYKALVKEDQDLFREMATALEKSDNTHIEARRALERLSDKVDALLVRRGDP